MGRYGSQYGYVIDVALIATSRISLITSFQIPYIYIYLQSSPKIDEYSPSYTPFRQLQNEFHLHPNSRFVETLTRQGM